MAAEPKGRREPLIAEASEWLARLDSGAASEAEFEAWRSADPHRAVAFAQVARTWTSLNTLRCGGGSEAVAPESSGKLPRRALLQAAGVVGLAATGAGALSTCSFARARAETAVGERRSVMLADGTHVELNTDTALAWRLKRDVRQLWLERGEAALSVAADRGRPFLLSANHTDTRLWPGQFDARLRGDSLDLAILSGRAQLQPRRALFTTAIGRSQAGTAAGGSGPSGLLITDTGVVDRGLSDIDLRAAVSWRRGEIVFDGEPLAGAVEEYNRYLTRKLVIGDRRLAGLRLDGRFPTSNPDGFLTVLNQAFGVRSIGAGLDQIVLIAAK